MGRRRMLPGVIGSLGAVAVIAGTLVPASAAVTPTASAGLHSVRVDPTTLPGRRKASTPVSLNDDGSVLAFESEISDLVPGDTNHNRDAFVWVAGQGVHRIGVSESGDQFPGGSFLPVMDRAGRTVSFFAGWQYTPKTRLIGVTDDRSTQQRMVPYAMSHGRGRFSRFELASVVAISDDARVMLTNTRLNDDEWRIVVVTVDGHSVVLDPRVYTSPIALSRDGSIALIERRLQPGGPYALEWLETSDPAVRHGVPVPSGCDVNSSEASLTQDGRRVLLTCYDNNGAVPGLYEIDVRTGRSTLVRAGTDDWVSGVSSDGRYYVIITVAALSPLDTNGTTDAYVVDRQQPGARLASVDDQGKVAGDVRWAVLSGDGTTVAFGQQRTSAGLYVVHLDPAAPAGSMIQR